MDIWPPLISVIAVSLLSVGAAIPLLIKKSLSKSVLLFFLSLSVGVLLSAVFFNLLPEAMHHESTAVPFLILAGFLVMFVLEKFVHSHHSKKCADGDCGHGHAYHLAPINLIGDGIHNFIDGLVIAGSYAVNFHLGITATLSIIFHEIPQEIADFGVLLYSGMSKKKALVFNFISASSAILGTIIGLFLMADFAHYIIPFAAGNFVYIAASNLLPQLHRHCKLKDTLLHLLAILLGIAIIFAVGLLAPEHAHA